MFRFGDKVLALRDVRPKLPGDLRIYAGSLYEVAASAKFGGAQGCEFVQLAGDGEERWHLAQWFVAHASAATALPQGRGTGAGAPS
jgi:hypothetical protein